MRAEQADDLTYLIQLAKLQKFKAQYGALVDQVVVRPDPDLLLRLARMFTTDAILDFGARLGRYEGHAGVARLFGEILPKSRIWVWHSFHSPIIDIDGDRASGQWTLLAYAISSGNAAAAPERIVGRYADEYVRVDGTWLQNRLEFTIEPR